MRWERERLTMSKDSGRGVNDIFFSVWSHIAFNHVKHIGVCATRKQPLYTETTVLLLCE